MNKIISQVENLGAIKSQIVTLENIQNSVLKRLIEEVRNEGKNNIHAYDRTHSRHNRGR